MTASPSPAPRPAAPPATPSAAPPPTPRVVTPVPATPVEVAAADQPSIGKLVSDASTHVSTLVRSEIELAKLELKSTVKNAGTGAGMFAAAGVVAVFSLVYGFQALAEGIAALGVYRWLAFLIVFVFQLLVAGLLVFLGIKKIKKIKAPEKTIRTTKETVGYLTKSRS